MQNKLIKILRIFFVLILVTLGILVLLNPAHTETNILKAIFSSTQNNLLVNLSNKFSAKINIIVECDDYEKTEKISKEIYSKIDKKNMQLTNINIIDVLDDYEKYYNNFLSNKTRNLLINKDYDKVEKNAYEILYNPIIPPVGSIENDPFLLFTDFIMNLSTSNQTISNFTPVQINDKYYSVIMLNVDDELALSPTTLNKEIKKIVDIKNNFNQNDVKIYLTGTPIHSYFASNHSIFEINFICVLSILFIIGIVFWYFKNLFPLIPITISIGTAIFSGYCTTALIFNNIHILAFVFSTTLIGICVDYSLHYFVTLKDEKDSKQSINKIFKSLSVSLITTVCAFLILLFANFTLLKEISVFTITGLITVYGIVVLFYPEFAKIQLKNNTAETVISQHIKFLEKFSYIPKPLKFVIFLLLLFGLFHIHFDDNIKNMYTPPKNLLYAEKLYTQISGNTNNTSIFVIKGENLENILQKEEEIADKLGDCEYQSFSKYIPSEKRQKSNQLLRKELYKNKLNDFAIFLSSDKKSQLINQKISNNYLYFNNNFEFLKQNFLLDKNTSIMIVSNYQGENINGIKIINFQKDISNQIKHCRKMCLGLLIPIFAFLYFLLAKIYDYKSGFKILLPSICAIIFVFGILGLFNCSINLFHILAIFLVIGFGLDYSVFRFTNPDKAGDSVFLSCLTTVFSFALLAFAGFKLISSLGIVLTLGLLSSYIFSLNLIICDKNNN